MLTNSQYNKIMNEYEAAQSKNRSILREHTQEVFEKIPELKKLDAKSGESALARYRAYASGDEKAIEGFESEIEKIRKQKEELLVKNGFPKDYIELHYDCPICRDTGYLEGGEKCSCLKEKERKLLYAQSRLEKILKEQNFDSFSFDYYDDKDTIKGSQLTLKAYMEKVVERCRNSRGNILFTGSTGTGKTFLSNCIAEERIKAGDSVIYLTAIELFDIVARVKIDKTDDNAVRDLYDRILDCDLLIIDDLGSELVNTMTNSSFFYILNDRLINKKATVISTNLGLNAMRDYYSERVTSRIQSEYDIIPLYGDDIRLKKRII